MKDNNIYISTNLQYLRKNSNKTQREIGNICGKTDTAISNWESGIREPDATDLGILANYFGITVDDIMFKDLRFQNNGSVDLDRLYNKSKDILNDSEREMIEFAMQKAINRYEESKNKD